MRKLTIGLAALALSLTISLTALGGNMPGGIIQPPPGQPATTTEQTTTSDTSTQGNMPGGLTATVDPTTELLLQLVNSLMSLF